ncbi:hypothetical protein THMIRHAM_19040 [Thiomicrorhabdus immobilis]|uniref:DUF5610 domain-containing protein n=1 Tax=Thiomicrorhabdus immobilis TaxID=2791037 RepID=A0ABM7MFB8_9GAMM|nr:hypothetical protein [Thiomicrorhabdus immobilis]BCN94119.1 hypothetical protein THMIRHAM_19040 [Thiomicrorhabdus immobilis]
MSNTIVDNPLLNRLFDGQDPKKNSAVNLNVADLAKQTSNTAKSSANQGDVTYAPSSKAASSISNMQQVERAYQYSETMSLQLTTKEGDLVTVDFRQLYAQYQSYKEMASEQQRPQGVRYFESKQAMEMTAFEEQFAFSVEGDLNEDELKAVFDVFEQVDSLSNQFFDGNIEQALQQAMELKIDFGQLSSFKLNLTQTESTAVRYQKAALAEYNQVQQQTEQPATGEEVTQKYGVDMSDLPAYLQNWQEAINRLSEQFENAQNFLNELMADVNAQRIPEQDSRQGWLERVTAFHEQLAQMAQSKSKDSADKTEPENAESLHEGLTKQTEVIT